MSSSSAQQSYYFASQKSRSNSTEIDHLSPLQEKKLVEKARKGQGLVQASETEPEIIQTLPKGSRVEEFYSRPVSPRKIQRKNKNNYGASASAEEEYEKNQKEMIAPKSPGYKDPPISSLLLERKVPVKIEPKAFFAAERTFLLWMHSSLWLFGAAMTIVVVGYDDPQKLIYGAMIMPVALSFMCYSLYQYIRRIQMLRRKDPGPYEDLAGPTILAVILMIAIIAQFGLKIYYIW